MRIAKLLKRLAPRGAVTLRGDKVLGEGGMRTGAPGLQDTRVVLSSCIEINPRRTEALGPWAAFWTYAPWVVKSWERPVTELVSKRRPTEASRTIGAACDARKTV
ncbi:hypothetical protein KM043_018002 [Ampulex compressa]|nr:hypothetical protein KM043_018002 [Ampulex compressa]